MIALSVRSITRGSRFGPFGSTLLLGGVLGTFGLITAGVLCAEVLIPFADACRQACALDPRLMTFARGSAALLVAVVGSGLLVGAGVLVRQVAVTRGLVRRVQSRSGPLPDALAPLASSLGLRGRLVYVVDPAPYAFCYGLFSPKVCISSGMAQKLSAEELRAVLLHEIEHGERRDPLKVLASRSLAAALFLVPVAASLRDRYLLQKEIDADSRAVEGTSPKVLAGALLKLQRSRSHRSLAELAAAAVGPFNVLAERVRRLAHPVGSRYPLGAWRLAASLLTVLVLFVATLGSTYAADRAVSPGPCCAAGATCSLSAGQRAN